MKGMKKVLCFIIFSFLFLSIACVCASATEMNLHESCVEEHFSWVQNDKYNKSHYPSNDIGNCAYVAMSLLLSYYDAYWHDGFIPYNYEKIGKFNELTGEILQEFHFKCENDDWNKFKADNNLNPYSDNMIELLEARSAYRDFINDKSDEYLQMYLISLAIEQGFHNLELVYGLYPYEMVNFLEYYLYDVCGFTSNQVTVHKLSEDVIQNTNDDLFNALKEHISKGFPVIYGGNKAELGNVKWTQSIADNVGAHAMLAYALTPNENDAILSYCWNNYPTKTFYTTEFKYFSSIIWLEINEEAFPHVCSDSYESVISGEKYCVCEIYSDHPNHVHKATSGEDSCPLAAETAVCYCGEGMKGPHNYSIASDNFDHWYECDCGARTNFSGHDYRYENINEDTHTFLCYCGHSIIRSHEYHTFPDYHTRICDCGYVKTTPHHFNHEQLSDTHHLSTCGCGYTVEELHDITYINYHLSACLDCGFGESTQHVYTSESISDEKHYVSCECGDGYEEDHDLTYQILENGHALVCECGYSYEEEHSLLHWNKYENHHVYVCECGYREQSEHNMVALDYHTSSCTDCGYTRVTPHEPPYQQLSDTQHLISCGCGYEGAENHIFTYTNISASHHRMTCECGYTALEVHTFKPTTNPRYQSCTRCGCVRDNFGPGGNVQMGKKEDEETE